MSKFAVVTGSSGGIGSAIVDAFLSDKYHFHSERSSPRRDSDNRQRQRNGP